MKKIGNIEFYNLTPHPIHVRRNKQIVVFKPDSEPLRIEMKAMATGSTGPFRCKVMIIGNVDIPNPELNENSRIYIVSLPTLMAIKARYGCSFSHIVAPDTNDAERDQVGNIVCVPGFIRLE